MLTLKSKQIYAWTGQHLKVLVCIWNEGITTVRMLRLDVMISKACFGTKPIHFGIVCSTDKVAYKLYNHL